MAIRLEKGGSSEIKIGIFSVGLGWQIREDASDEKNFDLDVSAFMVNASGKIPADDYFVFYNSENRLRADKDGKLKVPVKIVPASDWGNPYADKYDNEKMRKESRPVDPEISVIGSIDNEEGGDGDAETIDIDLSKVRADIEKIVICVSIHEAETRQQNFGQVENAYVRIYTEGRSALGQEEFIYDLTEDFSMCRSVEFAQLYRHNGTWKVKALGVGHRGELNEIVNQFNR